MFAVVSIGMYACHFIQNLQISKIFKISEKKNPKQEFVAHSFLSILIVFNCLFL